MSIQGLGSSASTASWLAGQLSRAQAQRSAEQLEAKAAALSAEAVSARDEADTAQRRADELQTQAGQARMRAEIGRQAMAPVRGVGLAAQARSAVVERIGDATAAKTSQGAVLQDGGRPSAIAQSAGLYTPAAETRSALSVQPGQIVDLRV